MKNQFHPKYQRKYFCPEIFCSFLGASWKLFGLPGDLVSNIINKEGYRKLKKLPGSPQEAQGRNIFVGILDKTDFSLGHFERIFLKIINL